MYSGLVTRIINEQKYIFLSFYYIFVININFYQKTKLNFGFLKCFIMQQAKYFNLLSDKAVQCKLCPHNCIIKNGNKGVCLVRTNIDGILYADNYAKIIALNLDPIEKKPLYNFYPGSKILSVGSNGCNLKCSFCQNYDISQSGIDFNNSYINFTPEQLVDFALKKSNNIGIAYTYNEPTIWFEFVLDTAKIANKKGLKNVMVTNGYINQEPLNELIYYIDAFNVDIKGFNNNFYKKNTGAKLEPVLNTIKNIYKSGKHLELTNLVVTGLNDNIEEFEKMVEWIKNNTSCNTPLHISRYFPHFKYNAAPTPKAVINDFLRIATKHLTYVYAGNI